MKVSCLNSVKFLKLKRRLKLKQWEAIGVLEAIWLFTQNNQPAGNIGKRSNEDIAAGIEWEGDADELLSNLLACGFIDEAECLEDRLVVHHWEHHCPTWLKGALAKNKLTFSRAKQPAKQPAKQEEEQDAKQSASLPSVTLPNQAIPKDNTGANSSHDEAVDTKPEPYPEDFERLWRAWPRRENKRAAFKAFRTAKKRKPVAEIMEAATALAASPKGKGNYCPHLSSWLNADGWADDRAAWQRSGENHNGQSKPAPDPDGIDDLHGKPFKTLSPVDQKRFLDFYKKRDAHILEG